MRTSVWTFWILWNDKAFGYNKLKQERFQWVLHNTKRKALNFSDAMAMVAPAWTNAISAENNQIAWRKGGLRPFSRMFELLFQ